MKKYNRNEAEKRDLKADDRGALSSGQGIQA